jgi:hypothetical protein
MKTNRSHCLICLARTHGIAIPTVPPIGQTVVGVFLTLAWLMAGMAWTLVAAVLVKREPRRRVKTGIPVLRNESETPATGGIATNPPTAEPVTIPAPICATSEVVEVPTAPGEVIQLEKTIALPVVPAVEILVPAPAVEPVSVDVPQVQPVSCSADALTWLEARNATADVEARASVRKARRTATVAAHEVSRPQAALDRSIAEAEAAIEEGKAWLAQRAAQKAEEKADLARLSVKRLRQLAVARGIRGSRTMRKDTLLTLLAG